MQLLLGFLITVLVKIVQWLFTSSANRFVTFSVLISILGVLLTSFTYVVNGAVSLLVYSMPDYFSQGMSLVVPQNLGKCVSAIVTVKLALFTYYHYKLVLLTAVGSNKPAS